MRTTLLLLVSALLLGAVLLLTNQKPDDRGNVSVPVLGGRHLLDANLVRWRFQGQVARVMQKGDDGRFRLVEPVRDLVSAAWLRQLADAYDSAQMGEKAAAIALEQTGVDDPSLHFEVEFPDARLLFDFGRVGLTSDERFVRRDGVVYRAGRSLFTALESGVDDLRERLVFRNQPASLQSLRIDHVLATGAREVLHLVLDGDQLRLQQPVRCRVDPGEGMTFVQQVLGLRIDQFPGSVWRPIERPADLVVDVQGMLGQEHVELWKDQDGNLVGRSAERNLAFVSLAQQFFTIFDDAQNRLRSRWLLPYAQFETELVRYVVEPGPGRGDRMVLQRQTGDSPFQLTEPLVTGVAPTPLGELLQGLRNCRVLQFAAGRADDPALGLGKDALAVSVLCQGQRDAVVLRLGADATVGEQPLTYALRQDEPDQVVMIPRPAADLLRRSWEAYVARQAIKVTGLVELLVLQRPKGDQDRSFRLQDGRWYLEGRSEPFSGVKGVVDDLRDLQAEQVRSARRLDLGTEDFTLKLCRREGDAFVTARVWDRGQGQPLLLQPENQPQLVYELSDDFGDRVRRLWQ